MLLYRWFNYENTLIYEISYKTLIGPKPLCIRFNKLEGFIRIYDRSRYSVLLGPEKYDDSFSSLPIEKILTLQSVIIFIKLVLNKYQNKYYYYKIFLEKYSYQLAKKQPQIFWIV